ncbi:RHS repeat domain-containing protein [Pseudomonas sp. MM213]|uniref:RHS repeat domain-containing protein n=1 Tax=Pseudomonas sp. MM213 TaxID=2866807 RepID=UPI001CF5BDB0|nr:RHS repeat-associated core domain-containing protein [Pseudomonas sp. MM213]
MAATQWIDAHTPSLAVVDSRGLVVRNVAYCRHPLNSSIDTRITRNHFDPAGRLFASRDPRLWGAAPKPNLENTFDLQGRPLLVKSVDTGWQLSLINQADATCSFWDGRGGQRHSEFDELQRPTAVTEQMAYELPRVSERFTYGDASDERTAHNQCGQPIRHDHPAGRRNLCEYGVGGSLLAEQTRFLRDLELPDWSSEFAEAELEDEVFETTWQYGPVGEMHCQTDAMDNVRSFAYDRAGQLRETRLKLAGSSGEPRLLVSEIRYDAFGRSISERAGNGVTTIARYAGEDGRLLQLQSCDVDGKPLQDFSYGYDPVGNITFIEDLAQLTRYFNNQRIDPVCCYGYDSLYQLIQAIGSEVSQPSYGPALPAWQTTPLDPNQLRNYTQTFNYDAAGNLQTRHHSGAETFEMFTATDSNRSVADKGNLVDGFDANGNQLELLRGQRMSWDVRNQLSSVTMVKRDDGPDDTECYCYDSPGLRLRKVRLTQAAHRTLRSETRYLPGLEIHRDKATGEERHVFSVEAGRGQVRALHWVAGLPRDVRNDQLRFCLSNHLNSSTLELDEQGRVLSREVYYAFGGTALWAGGCEIEAKYKTIRYSGKERDATGLYYYGYRYYAPWLQRWVSTDPAGSLAGLNLFLMVENNPIIYVDFSGLKPNIFDSIKSAFGGVGNEQARNGIEIHFVQYLHPKIMARKESDKNRALVNIMQRLPKVDAKAAEEMLEGFVRVLSSGGPTVNASPESIAAFGGSGFVNYWKGDKKDPRYGARRERVEEKMFLYQSSPVSVVEAGHSSNSQGFNSNFRPVYGALQVLDDKETVGGAPNYGAASFYFSDDSKKYMTMTGSDSLNMEASFDDLAVFENVYPLIPRMSDDTFLVALAVVEGRQEEVSVSGFSNYVEVQAHSRTRWSDFSEVIFHSKGELDVHPKNKKIMNFLNKNKMVVDYKN